MPEHAIDPGLPSGLPDDGRGTVVTIGTFDGVHRGHWEVLKEITSRAAATDRRSVLVTFHPHPLTLVRPEVAPPLLTMPDEKKEVLAESGLDYAVFLTFSPVLAAYSPRRFVEEILTDRLGMDELVIGYDHHFGKGRAGDADTMRALGDGLGFAVDVVGPVMAGDTPISSTRIRRALLTGDVTEASEGLGRPYSLRGLVIRGDGRGRTLGFPTANLHVVGGGPGEKLIPPPGIYAVWGMLRSGAYAGALHVGPRPTFRGSAPTIELHLMDFEGDIYGEEVRVDFVKRLRDVEPFDSVKALVAQIREDVDVAKKVLGSRSGAGEGD
ncbi:MAG: bifunctional riboflavin kinase/FAD synthetase [Gemmatimonadota bacterium]|nr:MAG: bifunctional riboflavin kinase/FAD synthetase [Gemmatimonadota bacterium]